MRSAAIVTRHELRVLWRGRVALVGLMLVTVLSAISALVAWERTRLAQDTRARLQSQVEHEFDSQPDRHPHRMVHYGHFVFRPLEALAAFDPGIDAYSGSVIFLEGHRQNSANFADVRQSSLLLRFGELTPAFVLQTMLPLLLVILGAGVVARDRDRSSLRLLLAQGASPGALLVGKTSALMLAGIVATSPAVLALLVLAGDAEFAVWLLAFVGYGLYLLIWTLAVVLVSTLSSTTGGSLRFLLGLWAFVVVLLPRVAPEIAMANAAAPARFETEFAIQRKLREIGDSHDENDPYFAAFQQKVLRQHGVGRVEDLPVNYKGLLAVEGERVTSELFDRHADELFETYERQAGVLDGFALASPLPAIRRVSMAAAQTDLMAHRRFVEQAERHRFDFVQRLNTLQAEAVTFADDSGRDDPEREKRTRIDTRHWSEIPDFTFVPEAVEDTTRRVLPAFGALVAWVIVLGLVLAACWNRRSRYGR